MFQIFWQGMYHVNYDERCGPEFGCLGLALALTSTHVLGSQQGLMRSCHFLPKETFHVRIF